MIVCLLFSYARLSSSCSRPQPDSWSQHFKSVSLIGFDFRFSPLPITAILLRSRQYKHFAWDFAVNSITLLSSVNSESKGFVCAFTHGMKRFHGDFVKTRNRSLSIPRTRAPIDGVRNAGGLWATETGLAVGRGKDISPTEIIEYK